MGKAINVEPIAAAVDPRDEPEDDDGEGVR
jgi:hypothetical protein